MTPAIESLKKAKVAFELHEYQHDIGHASYGLEAAEKLGLPHESVFKTLLLKIDKTQLVVAILPVDKLLNMKSIAKACKAKKAEMAEPQEVQRSTGYVLGGVSPFGQKKRLKTIIEQSAQHQSSIYVSGGRRGLEIELNPLDLQGQTQALFAAICQ